MHIFIEILGYIGSALIILSMTMKSLVKLRVLNLAGAVISAIYSIICSAWPVAILNIVLTAINLYHLVRDAVVRKKANETA